MRLWCIWWKVPPSDVILKNSVRATAKAGAQSCSHTPLPQHDHAQRTNTLTLRGHLEFYHSASTAKFITTLGEYKKTDMHSQHHLVQAQALGPISKIKHISLMIISARAGSDMPKSWVHNYYGHRTTMRECNLSWEKGHYARVHNTEVIFTFFPSMQVKLPTVACSITALKRSSV